MPCPPERSDSFSEDCGEFIVIEAASERPKVLGVAYSGGSITLPGWRHPVVVDLEGLEIPDSVPLLTNHENRTGSRVGVVSARVEGETLVIEGEILSSGGQARGIIEQAKAGADWQLSIGASVKESELVRGQRDVNGRPHSGPFYHVKKSVLREISVVAVGADTGTRMQVAATFTLQGGEPMTFEDWLKQHGIEADGLAEEDMKALRAAHENGEEPPSLEAAASKTKPDKEETAPAKEPETVQASAAQGDAGASSLVLAKEEAKSAVTAERERVAAIQDIRASEFPEIEREAVRAGWGLEETSQRVLRAMREDRPAADVTVSVSRDRGPEHETKTLEAALCLRAGIGEDSLLADYGEQGRYSKCEKDITNYGYIKDQDRDYQ